MYLALVKALEYTATIQSQNTITISLEYKRFREIKPFGQGQTSWKVVDLGLSLRSACPPTFESLVI